MEKAIARRVGDLTRVAALLGGVNEPYIRRWTDWSPTSAEIGVGVVDLAARRERRRDASIRER